MENIDPIKRWEEYLDLFKVRENEFLLGIFQNGITFYKQQVRAINIFYGLLQTKVLKTPSKSASNKRMRIGIIGGGIGGMTFAAVAVKTGFKVTLIEEKRMLLHMQHGCETRKIHPNVYDWPEKDKDSLSPYAKLPVLSWKNDTASRVADQIRMQFNRIHKDVNKDGTIRSEIYINTDIERISKEGKDIKVTVKNPKGPSYTRFDFDVLIYSPGYGVEKGSLKSIDSLPKTLSYWRNDDFSQPQVSNDQKEFVIWGTGDGALIDAFRLKIADFDLDDFLRCLKSETKNFELLTNIFLKIKEEWGSAKNKNPPTNWLWTKFSKKIKRTHLRKIEKEYILANWVFKNTVTIVGKPDYFEDVLNLDKASLLNCFIFYILININSTANPLKYCSLKNSKKTINLETIERSVVRYGTEREENLKRLEIPPEIFEGLKSEQHKRSVYDNGVQMWKYSDITDLFSTTHPDKKIEFFRTETVGICSNFISILSKVLQSLGVNNKSKKNFRIALHRIIESDGVLQYQQITSYFDGIVSDTSKSRSVGSSYEIGRGNVGYSIQTGKSLLIKTPEKKAQLNQLLEILNLKNDFEIGTRKSFLSIPILANLGKHELATNLVLYLDSEDITFFDDQEVIRIIHSSLLGFLESIKRLLLFNQILMDTLNFEPPIINPSFNINKDLKNYFLDLSQKYKFLHPGFTELKLENFHTFDIIYGSEN